MQDSVQRVFLMAARRLFPKDKGFYVINKQRWIPEGGNKDWGFTRMINPNPLTSSQFLVINNQNPKAPLTNLWFVKGNTGSKVAKGIFNGRLRIDHEWVKKVYDDRSLFSNIYLGRTYVPMSDTKVVFFVSHSNGTKVFISRPFSIRAIASTSDDFFDLMYKEKFQESVKRGKAEDTREIWLGTLAERLLKYEQNYPSNILCPITKGDKFVELWWRLKHPNEDGKLEDNYPITVGREEYIDEASKITDKQLRCCTAVRAHPKAQGRKQLDIFTLGIKEMKDIYTDFKGNEPPGLNQLSSVDAKSAQLNWIKRKHPSFPVYPSYHWAYGKCSILNICKEKLN